MFESAIAQLMALLLGELVSLALEAAARVLLRSISTDLSEAPFVLLLSQIATLMLALGDFPTAFTVWVFAFFIGALLELALKG